MCTSHSSELASASTPPTQKLKEKWYPSASHKFDGPLPSDAEAS